MIRKILNWLRPRDWTDATVAHAAARAKLRTTQVMQ